MFEIFQVEERIVKLFCWMISSFALCQKYFLAAFVTRYIVRWWHYCQYKTFCQTVVIAANKGTGIWNMSNLQKKTWAMVLQWQGKFVKFDAWISTKATTFVVNFVGAKLNEMCQVCLPVFIIIAVCKRRILNSFCIIFLILKLSWHLLDWWHFFTRTIVFQ